MKKSLLARIPFDSLMFDVSPAKSTAQQRRKRGETDDGNTHVAMILVLLFIDDSK